MDNVKKCCKQPENLVEEPSGKPDLILRRCSVCGCRHFELTMDPGKFELRTPKLAS